MSAIRNQGPELHPVLVIHYGKAVDLALQCLWTRVRTVLPEPARLRLLPPHVPGSSLLRWGNAAITWREPPHSVDSQRASRETRFSCKRDALIQRRGGTHTHSGARPRPGFRGDRTVRETRTCPCTCSCWERRPPRGWRCSPCTPMEPLRFPE